MQINIFHDVNLVAVINHKFSFREISRFIRVRRLFLLFLDVDVIEDVRVHVEEGESSTGVVNYVGLLCPWFDHNPFHGDYSFFQLGVVPNLFNNP